MSVPAKKIVATRPCPISGSKDSVVISSKDRHGKSLRNLMSVKSGLIYVDPVPFENNEGFYKTDYRKSQKGFNVLSRNMFTELPKFPSKDFLGLSI